MSDSGFPGGLTRDPLLGGRLTLHQPREGYRVAVDPVLLAAACRAQAGQAAADLGCGAGAVALCLAARVEGVSVIGLERESDVAALAQANIRQNGFAGRVMAMAGDVAHAPFAPGSFDHIVTNPPYLSASKSTPPAERLKRVAAIEGAADLAAWLHAAMQLLRKGGELTMVHRADRLDQIVEVLRGVQPGGVAVIPIWPMAGKPARRVIVRCRKGDASPFALMPGLVLHAASGAFTPAAENILRDGWALDAALAN